MAEVIKQVRTGGGAFALSYILSFSSEKDFVEGFDQVFFLNYDEQTRTALIKSIYKEARRMQKAEQKASKKEPEPETPTE